MNFVEEMKWKYYGWNKKMCGVTDEEESEETIKETWRV